MRSSRKSAGSTARPEPADFRRCRLLREGAFIGQHGSWNRSRPFGYKVAFIPFAGGKPNGRPVDVLTGFLDKAGKAHGRPVGVIIDKKGGLLVADDAGNAVWRVTGA